VGLVNGVVRRALGCTVEFSNIRGSMYLVGLWYLIVAGVNELVDDGFTWAESEVAVGRREETRTGPATQIS
jgi:hypothetical protein